MPQRDGHALPSTGKEQGEVCRRQNTADDRPAVHALDAGQHQDSQLEGEHQRPHGTVAAEDDPVATQQVSRTCRVGTGRARVRGARLVAGASV